MSLLGLGVQAKKLLFLQLVTCFRPLLLAFLQFSCLDWQAVLRYLIIIIIMMIIILIFFSIPV